MAPSSPKINFGAKVPRALKEALCGEGSLSSPQVVKVICAPRKGVSIDLVQWPNAFLCIAKQYSKANLSSASTLQLKREIEIQRNLDHPNIVALYASVESDQYLTLYIEPCSGGDLFQKTFAHGSPLREQDAVLRCIVPLLDALAYLHDRGILHRDLKLENLLLSSPSETGTLKLADFGFAIDSTCERPTTALGTMQCMPPEFLTSASASWTSLARESEKAHLDVHAAPIDIWAVGVLTFEMLTGRSPWGLSSRERDRAVIVSRIGEGPQYLPGMTPEAVSFISACLQVDPTQRPTAFELLNSALVRRYPPRTSLKLQSLLNKARSVPTINPRSSFLPAIHHKPARSEPTVTPPRRLHSLPIPASSSSSARTLDVAPAALDPHAQAAALLSGKPIHERRMRGGRLRPLDSGSRTAGNTPPPKGNAGSSTQPPSPETTLQSAKSSRGLTPYQSVHGKVAEGEAEGEVGEREMREMLQRLRIRSLAIQRELQGPSSSSASSGSGTHPNHCTYGGSSEAVSLARHDANALPLARARNALRAPH